MCILYDYIVVSEELMKVVLKVAKTHRKHKINKIEKEWSML